MVFSCVYFVINILFSGSFPSCTGRIQQGVEFPFFVGQHRNEFHNSFILQPAPPKTRFRVGVQMYINVWWACTHLDASYNDIRKHNKRETHHIEEWQGNKRLTSCQHISSKHENSKWGGCNLKKNTFISKKYNKRSENYMYIDLSLADKLSSSSSCTDSQYTHPEIIHTPTNPT